MVFHIVLGSWGQVCYCPQGLTDSQGKIVWSAHYRAYGQLAIADVEEIINPIRFQGQYHDLETGLYYNRHRYYDPHSARFTTIDPIGLAGGLNNYQYVPNPTGWVDPLGLASCKGDCPGGGSNLQLIDGKPPRNSEFAGRNYSLDVDKNPILQQRLDLMKPRLRSIREQKLNLLAQKYPDGVNFTEQGFADFNPYVLKHNGSPVEVDIERLNPDPVSGKGRSGSQLDMAQANSLMSAIDSNWRQPSDYTWHHVENSTKLQLVPSDLHGAVGHSGGRNTYDFQR